MTDRKVCILTGASGVIGYAIANALKASTAHHWHIIIIGRRPPPPSLTNVDGKPPPSMPYDVSIEVPDMTNEELVTSALSSHFESLRAHDNPEVKALNRLDLLVNCAGCSLGNEPICNVSADTFRTVLEVNVVGQCKLFVNHSPLICMFNFYNISYLLLLLIQPHSFCLAGP